MKKTFKRSIKNMSMYDTFKISLVVSTILVLFCMFSISPVVRGLLCGFGICLMQGIVVFLSFVNQYYVEIQETNISFVHVLRHNRRKEVGFNDISRIMLTYWGGINGTYALIVYKSSGSKKRYMIDGVDTHDFRKIINILKESGISIQTDLDLSRPIFN